MIPETYYWQTEIEHRDNIHTLTAYLDWHLPDNFEVVEHEETFAIIKDKKDGVNYGVYASGNGDFFNHKVEFELMEQKQ